MADAQFKKMDPAEVGALAAKSMGGRPMQGSMQRPDFSAAKIVKCENESCDSTLFDHKIRMREISALMSPTGNPIIGMEEVLVCTKCGKEYSIE